MGQRRRRTASRRPPARRTAARPRGPAAPPPTARAPGAPAPLHRVSGCDGDRCARTKVHGRHEHGHGGGGRQGQRHQRVHGRRLRHHVVCAELLLVRRQQRHAAAARVRTTERQDGGRDERASALGTHLGSGWMSSTVRPALAAVCGLSSDSSADSSRLRSYSHSSCALSEQNHDRHTGPLG
jgi:hypothetical protein